jgi:hypothetical protein
MCNRRTFLQAGALVSAAASVIGGAISAWPASAEAAAPSKIDFYKVLFDQDQPAATAFGDAASAAGLPTHGLRAQLLGHDLTALWYDDLYHRWREEAVPIAGMTPARVAFYMQMLGQDAGLRLVFRAEHTQTSDGRVQHRLSGPKSVLGLAALLDAGSDWSRGVAEMVRRTPAQPSDRGSLVFSSTSVVDSGMKEPLVSWVIGPVSRA